MTYTLTTAKGTARGTLDVADVDFDPDDLDAAVATIRRLRRTYR